MKTLETSCNTIHLLTYDTNTEYIRNFISIIWEGLSNFNGYNVWTDGVNIYYSDATLGNYILDTTTNVWTTHTWEGLTSFEGINIWTDGTNIYYSNDSEQYVLNPTTHTWTVKEWTGLTSFQGQYIWRSENSIFYSLESNQYILDTTTNVWTTHTWEGLTSFEGINIWTDGTDIYYSNNSEQYVLNEGIWEPCEQNGYSNLVGSSVWCDHTNIYMSTIEGTQLILNKETNSWEPVSWHEGTPGFDAKCIWFDGHTFYHSSAGIHHVLLPYGIKILIKSDSNWFSIGDVGVSYYDGSYEIVLKEGGVTE